MATSLYICGIIFGKPWQSTLWASSLLPSTLLLANFASVQAEPLAGHIFGSSTASLIYHTCASKGWPDPVVPIIYERSHGIQWKLRQWRFLMETRCHSETIRVPLAETVFKTQFSSL